MRRFFSRLANVFRGERADAEVRREITAHLALLEDEFRRRGMTGDEARFAARRALGSTAHAGDLHRDARSFRWLEDLRHDLAHAARSLRRTPGFAAVAILTLALGIGATTAIFSVISAVLLRPLPYPGADRLVHLFAPVPPGAGLPAGMSRLPAVAPRAYDALRSRTRTLSHVAGYVQTTSTLTGYGEAVRMTGVQISPAAFPMLRTPPVLGRAFELEEEATQALVVLSEDAWRRYFGGDPAVSGRVVALDGRSHTVVGVMPRRFAFPDNHVQYWVPYAPPAADARNFISPSVVARVRDGVPRQAAIDETNAIMREAGGPVSGAYELAGIQDELVASVRPALLVLAAAVGLVLLIACVNVANLLLARTAARHHELTVRRALGASSGRLIRQLLAESGLLAMVGGMVGIVMAFGGIDLLRTLGTTLPRRDLGSAGASLPRLDEIGVDLQALAFTVGLALLTGILCGVLPAIRRSRPRTLALVREHAATARSGRTLVVAEVAMAMMLLVGAGLLIRSFVNLAAVYPGYDATHVLTFQATPRQGTREQARAFADQVRGRLIALPGVTAAGYANNLPLVQQGLARTVSPRPVVPGEPVPGRPPGLHAVSRGFLSAMGMRIVEGRGFSDGTAAEREAIVTRSFARSSFFDGPALGKWIYTGSTSWQVVGILEDVKQFTLQQAAGPELYIVDFVPPPPAQGGTYFAVRTEMDPLAVAASVRAIAQQLDPDATVDNVATMEQIVANARSRPRLYAVLLGIFAAAAVILSAVGLYGVLAYIVASRTREIGVRIALGAQRAQVMTLVLRQSAVLAGVGVVAGVLGAAGLTRYLERLLFGLTPLDPATFVVVVIAFLTVAVVASYVPARRATRVDPMVALRSE